MGELVFHRDGAELMRFPLDRARLVLGQSPRGDVVLPDPAVPSEQCALEQRGTRTTLLDLSGHGTSVDGEFRAECELRDGAEILLGAWRLTYRETAHRRGGGDATAPLPDEGGGAVAGPLQLRIRAEGREQILPLTAELLSIGKDAENQLVLTDPYISSFHVQISRQRRGYWLRDLGSTNGTFLNGTRVREAELAPGSQIRVGETLMTLEPAGRAAPAPEPVAGIIGQDPALRQILDLIDRVAPTEVAVAIFGETGTGKELVARAVHARSRRLDAPFVPLNCAALNAGVIESELFGHEQGAFTGAHRRRAGAFESASGGTLFLDEVAELSLEAQAKLLRVLETAEIQRVGSMEPVKVDVRVVTATHRDLIARCRAGLFREDLFYRLGVFPLHLPPLRRRPGDLALLTDFFIERYRPLADVISVAPETRAKLAEYSFWGNVRELRNVVQRALVFRRGTVLLPEHIVFDPKVAVPVDDERRDDDISLHLPGRTEEQVIDEARKRAIRRHGGNKSRAAEELGVSRSTLTPIKLDGE